MVIIHRNFPAFEAAKLAASVIHWPCKAVLALRKSQPNKMPEASEASYGVNANKKSPYQHIILVSSCQHDQRTTCQIPSSWWQKLINMTPWDPWSIYVLPRNILANCTRSRATCTGGHFLWITGTCFDCCLHSCRQSDGQESMPRAMSLRNNGK